MAYGVHKINIQHTTQCPEDIDRNYCGNTGIRQTETTADICLLCIYKLLYTPYNFDIIGWQPAGTRGNNRVARLPPGLPWDGLALTFAINVSDHSGNFC